jgi:hypothetical protein
MRLPRKLGLNPVLCEEGEFSETGIGICSPAKFHISTRLGRGFSGFPLKYTYLRSSSSSNLTIFRGIAEYEGPVYVEKRKILVLLALERSHVAAARVLLVGPWLAALVGLQQMTLTVSAATGVARINRRATGE